jgi:methylglutaconyl-CoA hydratase
MEAKVYQLLEDLSHSGAQAMAELKKACWSGTEHWDQLLMERAAVSSRLLLLPEAQEALGAIKKGF